MHKYVCMYIYMYIHMYIYIYIYICVCVSACVCVSIVYVCVYSQMLYGMEADWRKYCFVEYSLFYRPLLQKRPIISRSLLIVWHGG